MSEPAPLPRLHRAFLASGVRPTTGEDDAARVVFQVLPPQTPGSCRFTVRLDTADGPGVEILSHRLTWAGTGEILTIEVDVFRPSEPQASLVVVGLADYVEIGSVLVGHEDDGGWPGD